MRIFGLKRLACVVICLGAMIASAVGEQLANNWNTDNCNFIDIAVMAVDRPFHLQRVELWYRWNPNETTVRYTVFLKAEQLASGEMSRADCDPYQGAWCIARVEPDIDLAAGQYGFRTEHAQICANAGSGQLGFLRAYGTLQ